MKAFFQFISERFTRFFSGINPTYGDESQLTPYEGKEKFIAFGIALFFSICLWFIVNLSRDFNLILDVPIKLTALADDVSVVSDVPEFASVSISGEGWKLLSIYTNPPRLTLSAEAGEVNMADLIRNQVGAFSDLNVMQVYPPRLTVETERRIEKRVPVQNRVGIFTRDRHSLISDPVLVPDSITIRGAETILEQITYWETTETALHDITGFSRHRIQLRQGERGVIPQTESVLIEVEAAEFTEAEQRVPIRTRNLPGGSAVTFNPSSILVRFDIPIHQYNEVQRARLFQAFVDFTLLDEDDSGFVIPEVELIEEQYIARIRSFQPPRVSYFRIVSE